MQSPALQSECVSPFLSQQTLQGGPLISRWQVYGQQCTSLYLDRHYQSISALSRWARCLCRILFSRVPLAAKTNQPELILCFLSCQVPQLRERQMARHIDPQQSHDLRITCFYTIFHCPQYITAYPCLGSPNLSYPNLPMFISISKRGKQDIDSKS